MDNSETPKLIQEFKYQILEENGKSRVIFEDKTYLLNTLRYRNLKFLVICELEQNDSQLLKQRNS